MGNSSLLASMLFLSSFKTHINAIVRGCGSRTFEATLGGQLPSTEDLHTYGAAFGVLLSPTNDPRAFEATLESTVQTEMKSIFVSLFVILALASGGNRLLSQRQSVLLAAQATDSAGPGWIVDSLPSLHASMELLLPPKAPIRAIVRGGAVHDFVVPLDMHICLTKAHERADMRMDNGASNYCLASNNTTATTHIEYVSNHSHNGSAKDAHAHAQTLSPTTDLFTFGAALDVRLSTTKDPRTFEVVLGGQFADKGSTQLSPTKDPHTSDAIFGIRICETRLCVI